MGFQLATAARTYFRGGWWKHGDTVPDPTQNVILNSDAEAFTVRSPIADADAYSWLGTTSQGSSGNWSKTSVVSTTGADGTTPTKVWQQNFTAGLMVDNGDGITLGNLLLPGGASYNEATIEYDVRFVGTVSGTGGYGAYGWGGKLPGLAGILAGHGSPPSGGSPSAYGWNCRAMWITRGSYGSAVLPAEIIGYVYDPLLPSEVAAGTSDGYGRNRRTGASISLNAWHHVKQRHVMNTVTTEGSLSAPANGIHQIWWDRALVYQNLAQVYRIYAAANINRLVWDNFFGGSGSSWAPDQNTKIQFDNFKITVPAA